MCHNHHNHGLCLISCNVSDKTHTHTALLHGSLVYMFTALVLNTAPLMALKSQIQKTPLDFHERSVCSVAHCPLCGPAAETWQATEHFVVSDPPKGNKKGHSGGKKRYRNRMKE